MLTLTQKKRMLKVRKRTTVQRMEIMHARIQTDDLDSLLSFCSALEDSNLESGGYSFLETLSMTIRAVIMTAPGRKISLNNKEANTAPEVEPQVTPGVENTDYSMDPPYHSDIWCSGRGRNRGRGRGWPRGQCPKPWAYNQPRCETHQYYRGSNLRGDNRGYRGENWHQYRVNVEKQYDHQNENNYHYETQQVQKHQYKDEHRESWPRQTQQSLQESKGGYSQHPPRGRDLGSRAQLNIK